MSDLDKLIDKINKYHRPSDINDFSSKILKQKVYLFVIDDGSFSSVTEIVWTSKDRPISVPTINYEGIISGVVYVSKETAIALKENRFRIAQMRGFNALKIMCNIKELNEVVIQGKNAHVSLECSEIEKIINKFE
jgi:hypothetical protein